MPSAKPCIPPHVQPGARGEPRGVQRDPNSGRFFRNGPGSSLAAASSAPPVAASSASAPSGPQASNYYPSGHPGARCF